MKKKPMIISLLSNKIKHFFQLFYDPDYCFLYLDSKHFFDSMSDEKYLKRKYHALMGKELDLNNPKTFNEKLQWLKLYDKNPDYIQMADKYDVKNYVANIIGNEYVIPTLGVWNTFEEIDFSSLPDQFVLKCTHDSGGIFICKDKSKLDMQAARIKINKSLNRNYYYVGREWQYKNIIPKIIAEEYIEESDHELTDYKIHCFNGSPEIILVCKNRFSNFEFSEDFFDLNWNHLDIHRPGIRFCSQPIDCPPRITEMITTAEKLSHGIPFLRVDFYYLCDKVLFGELTFCPAGGFKQFIPEKWDYTLGSILKLPKYNCSNKKQLLS